MIRSWAAQRAVTVVVSAALIGAAATGSAEGAAAKEKRCGAMSAAGKRMRVTIFNPYKVRVPSCRVARGVIGVYARTGPTQDEPLRTIRHASRSWDCYLARDDTGLSCGRPIDQTSYKTPRIWGEFLG